MCIRDRNMKYNETKIEHLFNNVRIQQIGVPTDIYNEPINSFVADFIGGKPCRRV